MTQASTRTSKVMRGKFGQPKHSRVMLDDVPDDFLGHFIAPNRTRSTNAPEQSAIGHARREQPKINRVLPPVRHWDRSHVATFSDQIDDGPVIFTPLDVFQAQFCQLSPTQPASQ